MSESPRLLPLLMALAVFGCDAPGKSVGQESQGETGCDPAEASCPETDSGETDTGGDTETGEGTETAGETGTGGEPIDCDGIDAQSNCTSAGCNWVTPSIVSLASGSCEVSAGTNGYCVGSNDGPQDDCGYQPYCDENMSFEAYVRQLDDDTWELHTRSSCFHGVPAGFTECVPGLAPAACDCACGTEASLPAGFETMLDAGGCADMNVHGGVPDGSIGIAITTGPDFSPVADAVAAGETTVTEHDVSEFSRFSVYVGDDVLYPECNDALEPDAYSIDQEWVATAGTVTIEIVPEDDPPEFATQGYATVTVTGLEVTYEGVTEAVGAFSFEDVGVGWLPG